MVTCTGHIGIHEGADGRTYVRKRTYVVRTDVHDFMAIKPNFLTSMGYHIFLTMVLRTRAAPLIFLFSQRNKLNNMALIGMGPSEVITHNMIGSLTWLKNMKCPLP